MKRDPILAPRPTAAARRRRALRRWFGAGYTAVEVLMSMAVLAVGVVGIIATEKITLASNLHAKNLAIATRIGEGWLGVLQAEAALWGSNGLLTRTTWLAQGAGNTAWFRPNYDSRLNFGPAFDALGNPVLTVNQAANARFCVDLRLTPLTAVNTGGGMIRAEVRVIWLRNENSIGSVTATQACSIGSGAVAGTNESRLFHFVFMTGAVRQVGT